MCGWMQGLRGVGGAGFTSKLPRRGEGTDTEPLSSSNPRARPSQEVRRLQDADRGEARGALGAGQGRAADGVGGQLAERGVPLRVHAGARAGEPERDRSAGDLFAHPSLPGAGHERLAGEEGLGAQKAMRVRLCKPSIAPPRSCQPIHRHVLNPQPPSLDPRLLRCTSTLWATRDVTRAASRVSFRACNSRSARRRTPCTRSSAPPASWPKSPATRSCTRRRAGLTGRRSTRLRLAAATRATPTPRRGWRRTWTRCLATRHSSGA